MNTAFRPLTWAFVLSVTTGMATAQQTPLAAPAPGAAAAGSPVKTVPKSTAQIDAGEPRATTSVPSTDGTAAGASAGAESSATPAGATPAGTLGSRNPANANAKAAAAGRTSGTAGQKGAGAVDRVQLGTATVTGDHEQPKVMYIVPWKRSDIGDLSGKPLNSLLDEALAPVDRDEFKREVAYYDAVKSDTSQNGAPNPASKQGEK